MNVTHLRNNRLHNQLIIHHPCCNPADVISHLGAIQAQDYSGALWSIGLRLNNTTKHEVEQALTDNNIIRTWLMRGTLHFAASKDLKWMQDLLTPRILPTFKRRYAELELDEPTLHRCDKILTDTLAIHKIMNRNELLSVLQQNGISTQGQRASHILQHTAFLGYICQTTTVKNVPNYILTDELPEQKNNLLRDEALAELASRYFNSRGPATLQDFAWWSGLTITDARTGMEAIKHKFQHLELGGQTYWVALQTPQLKDTEPQIHLLPGFDEFLLGYKNREVSLNPKYATQWCPGNNGMFMPFILKNGEVIGLWKKTVKKDIISIQPNYFKEGESLGENFISAVSDKYAHFANPK